MSVICTQYEPGPLAGEAAAVGAIAPVQAVERVGDPVKLYSPQNSNLTGGFWPMSAQMSLLLLSLPVAVPSALRNTQKEPVWGHVAG